MAYVTVEDETLWGNSVGVKVSDIDVELTSGFEAGQASFSLFDCYDLIKSEFEYKKVKDYIILGSKVVVSLGYNMSVREVFRGIIVRVDFVVDETMPPHVRVTAMDIKSIMMANHYHKRLTSPSYSGAIKEIFAQGAYIQLTGPLNVITSLSVTDTPDALTVAADAATSDANTNLSQSQAVAAVTGGSANTASDIASQGAHVRDTPPRTADISIRPSYFLCGAIFMVGLAGIFFARRQSAIQIAISGQSEIKDELD